jgi:uncharacterized damage-inducible protein DinB
MISKAYAQAMSRYNAWQNRAIYGGAGRLTDAQRREPRGAFFGSIHATLNHLLWADRMWLSRFGVIEPPEVRTLSGSVAMFEDWEELQRERIVTDGAIEAWARDLDEGWLGGDLVWAAASTGQEMKRPRALLVAHLFNHQSHHRGQVHCLLTGFGVDPGPTDLPYMPVEEGRPVV